ncbi:hypothetical protein D3C87_298600 [compost metagenome]
MKTIVFIIVCCLSFGAAQAQTWDEWFKQKKTQKKYLLQQIAALKVYIDYAQKGYKIAQQGLNFIGDMKDGGFNLHNAFFNSLKSINPEIRKYYKVTEIISIQGDILKSCAETRKQLNKGGMLRSEELDYINRSFGRMLDNCVQLVDELITLTTANRLELKDDERIKRIDGIHEQMQDNYRFARGFGDEAKVLSASRQQEYNGLQTIKIVNGIKE